MAIFLTSLTGLAGTGADCGLMTGCYTWANANGGRDGQAEAGCGRKKLVTMTDGFNQFPTGLPANYPNDNPRAWNTEMKTLATTQNRGANGILGTLTTVGSLSCASCACRSAATRRSRTGAAAGRRAPSMQLQRRNCNAPCPNLDRPSSSPTISAIGQDLNDVSSCTSGTRTHYFPNSKSTGESLPPLFRVIAGSIARGRPDSGFRVVGFRSRGRTPLSSEA
jgi:hypothetical protein